MSAIDRNLSQEEIDSVFQNLREGGAGRQAAKKALPYDFRRPDRIPKDQLRAIHLLHENFARSVASSLSAYLRAYVTVNLVSVEQISFVEFCQCLPSPTVLISLGMKPYDGYAILEMNPTLVFPILEMVLGGTGKSAVAVNREITEIEQSILDSICRIILHDLREAWKGVATIAFNVEGHETEPQLLQILAPNEAVVAVSMEAKIGENAGMMNLGIPSILVKMLRQKFEQQLSLRKPGSSEEVHERLVKLLQGAQFHLDARLAGSRLRVEDMLSLKEGDVLTFDYPLDRPLQLEINGKRRFDGQVVDNGRKRAFLVQDAVAHDRGSRKSRRPLRSLIAENQSAD
ncbi:MAG: flagellar motor switch protein FliM [Bryobacteraceae bacterium]|nr:flagellar motor switch protein FliM [Bryobacteraceae bacterium]